MICARSTSGARHLRRSTCASRGQHLPGIPAIGSGRRAPHRWAQATVGRVAADFARKWVGMGGDPAYLLDRSESNDRWPRRVGAAWLRRMRRTAGGRALPLTHANGLDKEEGAASSALRVRSVETPQTGEQQKAGLITRAYIPYLGPSILAVKRHVGPAGLENGCDQGRRQVRGIPVLRRGWQHGHATSATP